MLELISAIIFSISANLDNIIIGISYGTKKIDISVANNILISLLTTFVTLIAMYFGKYITLFIPTNIANIFGSSILILIGLYTIIKSIIEHFRFKRSAASDNYNNELIKKRLDYKELLVLALTLSLNNLGTGIAASITNMRVLVTMIFTFVFGFLFMYIGNKIGNKVISNLLGKYAAIISGLLLILLGLIEIINI